MKVIEIDRSKRLKQEPHTGHNRWHPDIPAILEVEPDEEVVLEIRDALDGQIKEGTTVENMPGLDKKVAHPLTGPVLIKGAQPGDLLEIEYLEIIPQSYGWSRITSGSGFLQDLFPEEYLAHWKIEDGWATSPELPGIRIPGASFMGTAGVAPSHSQMREWTDRETELWKRKPFAMLPDPLDAVPAQEPICSQGLRTGPPRENCGNIDAKQLTQNSRLFIPVSLKGALYSVGDAHFAQGDSECCVTAIEMGATVTLRFRIHQGQAERHRISWPRFSHSEYFTAPQWAVPRNFVATIGIPIRDDGTQEGGDLTLAARNALIHMIELLEERGWSRQQAYVICSVAVDLRVSNAVNFPNYAVSALLSEDIFQE